MADNLLFRKGSLAGLKTAEIIPGAISFTTDEPAIYLDVTENGQNIRKRVGDLIVYNTLAELKTGETTYKEGALVSDYSASALYYIVADNALLKWVPESKAVDGKWGWKQINSTAALDEALDGVLTRLKTAEDDIDSLENRMTEAEKDIDNLQADLGNKADPADGTVWKEISLLKQEDIRLQGEIDDLNDATDDLNTRVGQPVNGDTPASGIFATLADHDSRITTNKGNIESLTNSFNTYKNTTVPGLLKDQKDYTDAEIKKITDALPGQLEDTKDAAVEAANGYTDGKIGEVNTTVNNLKTSLEAKDAALQKEIDDLEGVVGTSADDADDGTLYGKFNTAKASLEAKDEAQDGRLEAIEKKLNASESGSLAAQVAQNKTDIATNKSNIEGLTNLVGGHTTSIGNLETNLAKEAQDRANADTALGERIDGLTTTHNNDKAALEQAIEGEATARSNADIALGERIDGLTNTHNTDKQNLEKAIQDEAKARADADEALEEELKEYVDEKLQAADAMKFMGVIDSSSDLPTTTDAAIEAGWTYKVGTDFDATSKINSDEPVILVGDLLIASADLAKGATIPDNYWHHVSSGYEDDKDQKLITTVIEDGKDGEGIEVVLTSHTGQDRGSVKITGATASNVRVRSSVEPDVAQIGSNSATLVVGLEWGEF